MEFWKLSWCTMVITELAAVLFSPKENKFILVKPDKIVKPMLWVKPKIGLSDNSTYKKNVNKT